MASFDLPETFDDLPNKLQYWPAPPGSSDEGLGMLRILTPDIVANAAKTQIQTGERICLNWDIENLTPPGVWSKHMNHKLTFRIQTEAIRTQDQMGRGGSGFRRRVSL